MATENLKMYLKMHSFHSCAPREDRTSRNNRLGKKIRLIAKKEPFGLLAKQAMKNLGKGKRKKVKIAGKFTPNTRGKSHTDL